MQKNLTKRIPLLEKTDGDSLPPMALKAYRIILSKMRQQNRRDVWIHDAKFAKLLGVTHHELGTLGAILRSTSYLGVRHSNAGCEYTHQN